MLFIKQRISYLAFLGNLVLVKYLKICMHDSILVIEHMLSKMGPEH